MLTWLKPTALAALAILAPVKPLFIATMVLVFFDLITGIMAARKKGEKITSAGLRRTLIKGVVYSIGIVAGFVAEKYMLDQLVPVSKLVAGAVGVTESLSIFENLNTISGTNVFQALLGKLGAVSADKKDPPKDADAKPPA